jgi:hypothetical protein
MIIIDCGRRTSKIEVALAATNTGNTGYRGETRQCYNSSELDHLKQTCPKPSKERDAGGIGQSESHDRGFGGRRGGRRGNLAHLMVAEEEEAIEDLTISYQTLVKTYSQTLRTG